MTILHLFSGYNTFSEVASKKGHSVVTVDIKNYKNCRSQSHLVDIMQWNYKQYSWHTFDFIMIGFPCDTFSKASGGFHFEKHSIPKTVAAHKSIEMLHRVKEIIEYFKNTRFMFENPTSAILKNVHFIKLFNPGRLNVIRVHQFLYGHCTYKQTDLITNIDGLWLSNPVHRVNGKNTCPKFENLSLKQRQSYPEKFCEAIIEFVELYKNS